MNGINGHSTSICSKEINGKYTKDKKYAIISTKNTVSGKTEEKNQDKIWEEQWGKLGAWFIGPTSENIDQFCELALDTIHKNARPRNYFPSDQSLISSEVKASSNYCKEMATLKRELHILNDALLESIPYSSVRYQGHMVSETTIAAKLGYLSAWMTNANNASSELGPVTTKFEIAVGHQLCEMLGYDMESTPRPWGHITNGGSIANIEALWSSRNTKYFPLAVQKAIKEERCLSSAKDISVYIPRLRRKQKITACSTWDLLNLDIDDIVSLPQEIQRLTRMDGSDLKDVINRYSLAQNGFVQFYLQHGLRTAPVVMASAANHYSWSKAATLLGTGTRNLVCVPFDQNARMNILALRKLLEDKLAKKIPVISVICVVGTTEHGAIDPVTDVLELRKEFRSRGLNFVISADGAWGGYYATLLKKSNDSTTALPRFPISDYTNKQLYSLRYADTVTIDPHKSGYCPYPAGGLCYRNGHMKAFIATATDMVFKDEDQAINCYGVEASKPGAGPSGVYLAHKVIGLNRNGYGRILGQSILGAKLMYCAWLTVADNADNFVCIPLTPLPDEFYLDEDSAKQFIREKILDVPLERLLEDDEVLDFLSEVGPDVAINAFAVNIKNNTSVDTCNRLNLAVFEKLSQTDPARKSIQDVPFFLTKSRLAQKECIKTLNQFKRRLGVSPESVGALTFLKNTVTNPWTAAENNIENLMADFRKVVLQCIFEVTKAK